MTGERDMRYRCEWQVIDSETLAYTMYNTGPDGEEVETMEIHLYVEDVDAFFEKALAAGAKELKPVMDQFYGDRSGQLQDPFGHLWWVATHKEDVTPEEIRKRLAAMCSEKK
jgi:PhnB protein